MLLSSPLFLLLFVSAIFLLPCSRCFVTNGLIWSRNQQDFIQLFSLPYYAELRREYLEATSTFTENCNGEKIRVGYFQNQNVMRFYDNDTKVAGMFGDVWNLLAEHLNFTLVPVNHPQHEFGSRLCNGTYTGVLGLLIDNKIDAIAKSGLYTFQLDALDYTMPVWRTKYNLYIRPKYNLDNKWIITLFAPMTWCCVWSLFLILSVVGYVLQTTQSSHNKPTNAEEHYSLFEHVFYTFALMCAQGYVPSPFYNRQKLLSFSKTIFCWFTLLTFSSHLIYRMTNRMLTPPFTDLDSLLNSTAFQVIIFNGAVIIDPFKKMAEKAAIAARILDFQERVSFAPTTRKMYQKVCFSKKLYAMFEINDRYQTDGRLVCPMLAVGRDYFNTWSVLPVSKGFRYKKLFNAGIMKLRESGILASLEQRYAGLKVDNKLPSNVFQNIDMNQVYLIFLIFCCGVALSMLIFVLEQCAFLSNNDINKKARRKKNVLISSNTK